MAYGSGVNSPNGLVPVRHLNGSTWNEQTNQYRITSAYATSIGQGDLVSLDALGVITKTAIAAGGAGNPVVGVFWGCKYKDSTGKEIYSNSWVANTAVTGGYATAYVIDSPDVLFSVQVGGAALTLLVTDLYCNYDFVIGAPNSVGVSTSYLNLNSATLAPGLPTYNLKAYDLDKRVDNAFGVNYNNALVLLNNHSYKSVGTAGI